MDCALFKNEVFNLERTTLLTAINKYSNLCIHFQYNQLCTLYIQAVLNSTLLYWLVKASSKFDSNLKAFVFSN